MHQPFVTTAPHPPPPPTYGDERGIAGLMCEVVQFWAPLQCQACDIMQIYPRGIYYYKEQGYVSQHVPAVQGL